MNKEDLQLYIKLLGALVLSIIFVEDRYAKQEQIKEQQEQIKIQNDQLKIQNQHIENQEKQITKQKSQLVYIINTLSEKSRKQIQQSLDIEESIQ